MALVLQGQLMRMYRRVTGRVRQRRLNVGRRPLPKPVQDVHDLPLTAAKRFVHFGLLVFQHMLKTQ